MSGKKRVRTEYMKEYQQKHIDVIRINVQKPVGAAIRKAAKDSGQSLQGYIVDAAHDRMKKEGKPLFIDPDTEKAADQEHKEPVSDEETGECASSTGDITEDH